MSITNFLRGAGQRVASVGRAVQAASRNLDQAVAPKPAAPPQPLPADAAPAAQAPRGFTLPDLGPPPDATASQYQGEAGTKQYESDTEAYNHKQDIHKAYQDLDQLFAQMHPGRDFQKEYEEQVQMLNQQEQSRPQGNNLARAALALGDFNPAVKQSGHSNLDTYNQNVEKSAKASDDSFSKRMLLRQQMHAAKAAEAEEAGNYRLALREKEQEALAKVDAAKLEHTYKLQEIGAVQAGATQRAEIMKNAMERRAQIIAQAHGLSGSFAEAFEREAAKTVAGFFGPREITKDYSPPDPDQVTDYLEHIAEVLHDQQHGTTDGGAKHLGTHPSKRTGTPKDNF